MSLWLPLGVFGVPLAAFGPTLGSLWLPLAPFGASLGCLWGAFGALGPPLGQLWAPFGSFGVPLGFLSPSIGSLWQFWAGLKFHKITSQTGREGLQFNDKTYDYRREG